MNFPAAPSRAWPPYAEPLREALPRLAGANQVLGVDGEFWSPRKLLRCALWHELNHIAHIIKLL